jgi:hypothetical protein
MKRLILTVAASVASIVLLTAGLAAPAFANTVAPSGPPQFFSGVNPGCPDPVTSSGNATTVNPNAAQLTSVCYGYGGVFVNFPGGTPLSQLSSLSTNYTMTQGTCGGGAPRFEVDLSSGDFFLVNFGAQPFGGCSANTFSSTDAVANGAWSFDNGNTYMTYAQVEAAYGTQALADVAIIDDGGWSQGSPSFAQQALIQNWNVNGTVFFAPPTTPTSKDQCKNGGWKNYTDANGTSFKNQGDCVSYVATGGRNSAAG